MKLSHLIVIISGVIVTVSLSFLPKYVVNDKEKSLRDTEAKVRQEVTNQSAQHASSDLSNQEILTLKTKLNNTENPYNQVVLVDSITKLYRDAFALDSAMYTYLEYAHLSETFYVQAVKDGLTGLQMNSSSEKGKYYKDLCEQVIKEGFSKNPENKELLVQKLRLEAFTSKAPMKSILAIKDLVDKEPDLLSARITYAEFLVLRGQINPEFLQKAVEQYTKVAEIDVDNLQSRIELVTLHSNLGNASKAKEYLLQLQKINKIDKDPFIKDFIDKNLKN